MYIYIYTHMFIGIYIYIHICTVYTYVCVSISNECSTDLLIYVCNQTSFLNALGILFLCLLMVQAKGA